MLNKIAIVQWRHVAIGQRFKVAGGTTFGCFDDAPMLRPPVALHDLRRVGVRDEGGLVMHQVSISSCVMPKASMYLLICPMASTELGWKAKGLDIQIY